MAEIPEIDIGPLRAGTAGAIEVARAIDRAGAEVGFFLVMGHGIDPGLQQRLDRAARTFFGLDRSEKEEIAMARAGRSWRGWFPLGQEFTSGLPDQKEGLYFGRQLGPDDPRVQAGVPLHGANLFPRRPRALRRAVNEYMAAMVELAETLLVGIALGLDLAPDYFARHLTQDPLVLFRIFTYPPLGEVDERRWSVGEHTDYGLLSIVGQDTSGGLQVHTRDGWIDVPVLPGRFVCNLGDMLERLTGDRYRSTLHRVRHDGAGDRLSFPFFFDPSWEARVETLPIVERPTDDDGARRWDHASLHGFSGTYGDYILAKVKKVFPDLARASGADGGEGVADPSVLSPGDPAT